MKKLITILLVFVACSGYGQLSIEILDGSNYSKVRAWDGVMWTWVDPNEEYRISSEELKIHVDTIYTSVDCELETRYNVVFNVHEQIPVSCGPDFIIDDITGEKVFNVQVTLQMCYESKTFKYERKFSEEAYNKWKQAINRDRREVEILHLERIQICRRDTLINKIKAK